MGNQSPTTMTSKRETFFKILFATGLVTNQCYSKHFERCELARELLQLGLPGDQLNDWLCLVEGESQYNSRAIGSMNPDNSFDHGLFQISEKWWCHGKYGPKPLGCRIPCSALLDDDIRDDVKCVKKIYDEWQRTHDNGFLPWVAWNIKCQNRDLSSYSKDCFNLKVKDVTNVVDAGSPVEYKVKTPTLKEIVLSQGGDELQSLWEKFFGNQFRK